MKQAILVFLLFPFLVFAQADVSWYSPWGHDKGKFDLSYLNSPITAAKGFVSVNNGHTWYHGSRLRLYGTAINFTACFPSHSEADSLVDEWSSQGINIVRFHNESQAMYYPSGIWKDNGDGAYLEFDNEAWDRHCYLISVMKSQGIFMDWGWHVSMHWTEAEGCTTSNLDGDKGVTLFDPIRMEVLKAFADSMLTKINPYTGLALVDDPVLVLVEGDNENDLMRAWNVDDIDELPEYFHDVLDTLWYEYEYAKYGGNIEQLREAWGVNLAPTGMELITNGQFDKDVSGWTASFTNGAEGSFTWQAGAGPNGSNCGFLQISKLGASQSDVSLYQNTTYDLHVGYPYSLCLWLISSEATGWEVLNVIWPNLYGSETYNLDKSSAMSTTTTWGLHTFNFWGWSDDTNFQYKIDNMGDYVGYVAVDSISLVERFPEHFDPVTWVDFPPAPYRWEVRWHSVPEGMAKDYIEFLKYTNNKHFADLKSYLVDSLGYHGLFTSTQYGFTPYIPNMDYFSQHGMTYGWSGDASSKYHRKSVLTIMKDDAIEYGLRYRHYLQPLSHVRAPGVPMIADEVAGDFAPNPWAECYPLIAVNARLQDIDGLIYYAYASVDSGWSVVNYYNRRRTLSSSHKGITSDMLAHPTKIASNMIAAWIFRASNITPSTDTVRVYVDSTDFVRTLIPDAGWLHWSTYPAPYDSFVHACHWIPAETALTKRVEFVVSDSNYVVGDTAVVSHDTMTSSTGEITWCNHDENTGWLTVSTGSLILAMGDIGGKLLTFGDVKMQIKSPSHCTVAIISPDNTTIKSGNKWKALITAYGKWANTGFVDSTGADGYYYLNCNDCWGGTSPTLIEPVEATITFPTGMVFSQVLASIDSIGVIDQNQAKSRPLTLQLSGTDNTLWYYAQHDSKAKIIVRKRP